MSRCDSDGGDRCWACVSGWSVVEVKSESFAVSFLLWSVFAFLLLAPSTISDFHSARLKLSLGAAVELGAGVLGPSLQLPSTPRIPARSYPLEIVFLCRKFAGLAALERPSLGQLFLNHGSS